MFPRRCARFVESSLLVAVSSILLAACAVNPATGRRQLSLIGEEGEIEMGREADGQIVASLGLYPDSAVQAYVRALGLSLAAQSERPSLPWTFRVVDDPTVNAFALPGGFIYITRGILSHLTSEAQLVGVLGHEIGHVTGRHSVNQMSRQQLAQLGLGVGMILSEDLRSVGDLASAGLQLLSLRHSRGDETEADELGIRYMRRTGHDPRELAGVMGMLGRTAEVYGGGGRVPEWLSTHPDPANRVENIRALVAGSTESSGGVVDREAFLRRLDGLVFGPNPREGFFDGASFHHPELAFRIDFPQGWKTVNQKAAVQGVSVAEDAILVLTLAGGSDAAALADFRAQEGVSTSAPRSGRVQGLNTAGADFSVQAEGGEMVGTVRFVEHRGATYRLLGYASVADWAGYRGAVQASVDSFRRETDRAVLSLQPDRLEIVSLGQDASLEAFVTRYPSVVASPIVALINQIADTGTFARGSLAKQVVGGR
jgi:predicted Zn-dependent protease